MTVKAKPASRRTAASNTAATRKQVEDKKAAPQQATVPDQSMYDTYVGREIVPGKTDMDVFDYARKAKLNVLIEGPTGCAKTSAVLAYAAREGRPFYAVPSNIGIDPSQLFGKFVPMPDGSIQWVDGPVTHIVRVGGVLLINEVNFMPDRVATVLFMLLDKRRQITLLDHQAEVIDAADDLLIIADMNPEYEGTRPLNKAFRNRFAIQLQWGYDEKVEAQLIKSKGLREMAQKLRTDAENGAFETPCSTNMLMEFEKTFADMGYDFAAMNFISHYATDERQAASLVLETYKTQLEEDLDDKKRKAREAEERKAAREKAKARQALEDLIDPARADKQSVREVEDPSNPGQKIDVLHDEEWGDLGIHWEWDDDDADVVAEAFDAEDDDDDDDDVPDDDSDVYDND